MKFEIFLDSYQEWRWRLRARNGRIIASSAEGYKNKTHCEHMVKEIKCLALFAKVKYLP